MLKTLLLIPLLLTHGLSNLVEDNTNSFITQKEYGKMLYFNPRGIGCHLCHGNNGEGKFIASYKHKGKNDKKLKTFSIKAPSIQNLDLKGFVQYIKSVKSKSIMPKYFLTDEELHSIYIYLKGNND